MAGHNDAMRAKVLDAALQQFSAHGYDGTSMRGIANEVGVVVGNLYNYTDGKETLFWTVYEETMVQLQREQDAARAAQTCSAGRVAAFVKTHALSHARRRREAQLGNVSLASLSPERATLVRAVRGTYENTFRDLVDRGVEDGFFAAGPTWLPARAILQMCIGIAVWFRPDGELTSEEVGQAYAKYALAIVGFDHAAHEQRCPEPAMCAAGAFPRHDGLPRGQIDKVAGMVTGMTTRQDA